MRSSPARRARRPAALVAVAALAAAPLAAQPSSLQSGDDLTALVREVQPIVEQLRGKRFRRDVPVKVVDQATAGRHFRKRAERFWPAERARVEQRALIDLGLLPAGFDMLGSLFELLESQVAGFYDPETDTFYVLQDMPRASAPIIVAHELTHALDDQHWDIDAMLDAARDDEDRQAAFAAVVEGSGTLVMTSYLLREMQAGRLGPEALLEMQKTEAGRAASLQAAPAYLQRSLIGPYLLGQTFLLRGNLLALASWSGGGDIDEAFASPPASFEQILHPEKYWDAARRDVPGRIALPDQAAKLGPGWKLAVSGTLGEMSLAVMTGLGAPDVSSPMAGLSASWTNAAATGWDGDRYQHYANGSKTVTLLATRWDSENDAVEFEKAATSAQRRVWRRGTAVVVLAGSGASAAPPLADAALQALAAR